MYLRETRGSFRLYQTHSRNVVISLWKEVKENESKVVARCFRQEKLSKDHHTMSGNGNVVVADPEQLLNDLQLKN